MPELGQSLGSQRSIISHPVASHNQPQLMLSRETDYSRLPGNQPCLADLSKRAPQLGQSGIWSL